MKCSECKFCGGIFQEYYECRATPDFEYIHVEFAENSDLECDLYVADLRHDNAN